MTTPIASEPELPALTDERIIEIRKTVQHGKLQQWGDTLDFARAIEREVLAALSSRSGSAAETAGWRLVPVEATQEMIEAGCNENEHLGIRWSDMREAWSAMLAAVPERTTR